MEISHEGRRIVYYRASNFDPRMGSEREAAHANAMFGPDSDGANKLEKRERARETVDPRVSSGEEVLRPAKRA